MKEHNEREMMPRPHSLDEYLLLMQMFLSERGTGDIKVTLQFEFTGEVEGDCYIAMENGVIQTGKGKSSNPDLILRAPFELLMDVLQGKANALEAFLEGMIRVEGNLALLMGLGQDLMTSNSEGK